MRYDTQLIEYHRKSFLTLALHFVIESAYLKMHPAISVIIFTSASGAGYGLLGLIGISIHLLSLPNDYKFHLVSFALAFTLITGGLLASTFHLGHPERAWRSLSQWRSSWLSREGILALLTYIPASIIAFGYLVLERYTGIYSICGLITTVLCILTVFSTSMIYASLRTIRAWNNFWVPISYLSLSLMTGFILLNAILVIIYSAVPIIVYLTIISIIIGCLVKSGYWYYIKQTGSISTAETATGLGYLGKVTLLQGPHTQQNYLQKEMGFQIARKHAERLRLFTIFLGFVLPLILTSLTLTSISIVYIASSLLAVVFSAIGVLIERWLFFAEAKHTVMLYYGYNTV